MTNVNDMPSDWDDMEDAHIAFGELDVRERIAIALLDENGLRPTQAALDVIMATIEACDNQDEYWSDAKKPGVSSPFDYADMVIDHLNELYVG